MEAAAKEGNVDPSFGLENSGIAGTEPEKDKSKDNEEKKDDEGKTRPMCCGIMTSLLIVFFLQISSRRCER